jgi:hypothetical protein
MKTCNLTQQTKDEIIGLFKTLKESQTLTEVYVSEFGELDLDNLEYNPNSDSSSGKQSEFDNEELQMLRDDQKKERERSIKSTQKMIIM